MLRQATVSLGNLLLSLSDALDLASPALAQHQQRVAFVAWEMGKIEGLSLSALERVYVAGLLHDIGALSLEEKSELQASETVDPALHCIRGQLLFEDIPWLTDSADIIRHHHRPWTDWTERIDTPVVIESQLLALADFLERQIDRSRFILHQSDELTARIRAASGTKFHPRVVDSFMECAVREEFWFDLASPRLYSLLLHHGPYRRVVLDASSLSTATRLFQNIIDFKSPFTATHSSGVAASAVELARVFGLTETEIATMEIAGRLHDIGKLAVPNRILDKPGRLTREEFAVVRQHTYFTYTVLNTIDGLHMAADWAAYHHETLDGTGYPFHRNASELDTGARIMAVADIYTALAEDRPYRRGMSRAKVVEILRDQVKRQALDDHIVRLLVDNLGEIEPVVRAQQEEARAIYERKFA